MLSHSIDCTLEERERVFYSASPVSLSTTDFERIWEFTSNIWVTQGGWDRNDA